MSEFKWVPEVGMKVKVGSSNDSDYVGVLLPEFSHVEYPTSELVILSERRKKVLSWSCRSQILKPVGKKSKAHYAKAKKEWEDAQVIGVGDWVERVTKGLGDLSVGDVRKVLDVGLSSIKLEHCRHVYDKKYFRKLTPAEVAEHEASLVLGFEVGDYVYHIDEKNDLTMWRIKSISNHCLSCELEGVDIKGATCSRLLEHLRPATPEEIKAATRTVRDLDIGDTCFWLMTDGDIHLINWNDSGAHKKIRERGNIFLTREEAEAEDARRVAANSRDGGGV